LGSIFQAVQSGYRRIGLVDGLFGTVPSVWHKEILYAIAMGAEVVGAASMGALRAAELDQFGMVGIGVIYRCYRREILIDDDEVSVLHAIGAMGFAPLTIPMINLRLTFRHLKRMGKVTGREMDIILLAAKSRHFSQRTIEDVVHGLPDLFGVRRKTAIVAQFYDSYIDQKHRDYAKLVNYVCHTNGRRDPHRLDWHAIVTRKWVPQFEYAKGDLPPLERW
jgi:hypothetical protein